LKDCQQILQFYGLTSDGDKTYLVTEWAELRNLKEYYTAYKPIGVKKKLRIAIDIARGLNFLRAVDIIHRDIRSENILITHHETAKIANFYLSRHFYDDTKNLEATQDTVRYAAPEILRKRDSKYTTKCEIFSFGILLWELAEERTPYAQYSDLIEIKELVVDKKYRERIQKYFNP
ncbi:254_t:CDS:2, partial [Ambispora leptoticha]